MRNKILPLTLTLLISGCGMFGSHDAVEQYPRPPGVSAPGQHISLARHEQLFDLSHAMDKVAIQRSAALQEVRAAQARLSARGYDFLPRISPTGFMVVDGENRSGLGISLEQMLWDADRTDIKLGDAELMVAEASLRAWSERNSDVYDGLKAYVNLSRFDARLRAYAALEQELDELAELLQLRADGGVADRGELLRMRVARQEVERDVISDVAAMSMAQTEVARFVPEAMTVAPATDMQSLLLSCTRNWPQSEAPMDALNRVAINRSQLAEEITRSRRFPRLVLDASTGIISAISTASSGVSLKLDAADMLGLEGTRTIEAAKLDVQASISTYESQQIETQTELARLEVNYMEFQNGLEQLLQMQAMNQDTVDLYQEQLNAGSIPLTAGIELLREETNTEVDIINFRADLLLNCLQSSQLRGHLVPFQDSND